MSEVDGVGDGGDADLLALLVRVRDEPGSLYRVSEAIYKHGGNVTYVSTISGAEIQFEVVEEPVAFDRGAHLLRSRCDQQR